MERRSEPDRSERLADAKARLAARLQRVCADMPRDEFDDMVEHMAGIEIKYAIRRAEALIGAPMPR